MVTEGKAPKLRFKGFTNDWKQQKIQFLIDKKIIQKPIDGNHGAKHPKSTDYKASGIPFLMASDIRNGKVDLEHCKFISKQQAETLDKGFSKNGDVLITHKATIGETAILDNLKTDYAILTPQITYYRIINKNKLNRFYLLACFNSPRFQNKMKRWAYESTRPYIGIEEQHGLTLALTSIDEQKQIGKLFQKISNDISLQQRKLDQLQELKKGFLQNLFPTHDALVPHIRFKDFYDDWKQLKLVDHSKIFIGLVTTMTKHYSKNGTFLIRNSDIAENNISHKNPIFLDNSFAQKNYNRQFKIDDVVTVHTGDIGTSAVISKHEKGAIGFATIGTRPDLKVLNSFFLSDFLNSDRHKRWAVRMSTGDGRSNYNLYDFKRLVIPAPSVEEQKRIAEISQELDNQINLQQKKIDQLQQVKNFLLQNMFI